MQLICPSGCFEKGVSSPFRKNILIFRNRKSAYNRRRPTPLEGRIAIVTDAGLDAMDAGSALDERR
jgi:hypothetical protein